MKNDELITVTKPDLPPLEKYNKYLRKIWESRWLTNNGELMQLFEKKLEEYLKIKNIAVTGNGTLALHISLKALNLKGEVITTPFTFAATTNVLVWEGLTPVFADINPETFNIDPEDVEQKITDKTCAILAVHVFGNPCYVKELEKIAREYNLKLIYDSAHAFGVEYEDRSVLDYGDISILSFHATKVFHTIEGGAIITKHRELFEKVKLLRNHGIKSEEEVILPGTNAKMSELQAAMGLCNLENIDKKIRRRKILYNTYKEELSGLDIKFQKIVASKYNYSYMPTLFRSEKIRDKIYLELLRNNIKPRKYFYPLTPDFSYFKNFRNISKPKVASNISNRVLCLPLYPELKVDNLKKITNIIKDTLNR